MFESINTILLIYFSVWITSFIGGASTASHQVEGDTYNQWSKWEKANAKRLADSAQQRLGWLPNFNDIKAQAKNPNNYFKIKKAPSALALFGIANICQKILTIRGC